MAWCPRRVEITSDTRQAQIAIHGKGRSMREEPITWRDYALALALLALLLLALAIQGGAWGPSDLELFKRAAGL